MATDNFSRVLYNDGEGLTHGDLNDSQTFIQAHIADQLLQSLIGSVSLLATDPEFGGQNGTDAPSHLAYALHAGSAYLRPGTDVNKIQIAPGTLLQKVGTTDGATPTLLAYTFDGTEEVTITAGNGANPRVDLVQMKLELIDDDSQTRDFEDATTRVITSTTPDKKKRVQCTLSVKTGTPAASPQYPDPDSGYVAVAGVVVGTSYLTSTALIFGYDTAGANAVVHDQRMPLNVQGYYNDAITGKGFSNWTLTSNNMGWINDDDSNDLRFFCPKSGNTGRIVGIQFKYFGVVTGGGTISLSQNIANAGGSSQSRNILTDDLDSSGVDVCAIFPYYAFEALHAPEAGPTVLPSSTNQIGAPLWTNGYRCAVIQDDAKWSTLTVQPFLRFQTGSGTITPNLVHDVTWFIAQGI